MDQPHCQQTEPLARRASDHGDVGAIVVLRLQQSKLFREYQQAFEDTLGLPLVLRAAGSFLAPLQGSKRVNPFCALMTRTNRTCAACLQFQQRVEEEATLQPKTMQCYAGLSETAVPVRVGDRVIGYLQTGQVFLGVPSKRKFRDLSLLRPEGEAGADRRLLESAYFETKVLPRERYESIIRLLTVFAEHLATVSNQLLICETTAEPPLLTKVRKFITEHQSDDICLNEVARAMSMSAFYFCKLFKKTTGLTFTEYLARKRIESVKQLLLSAHTRVSEAAYAAGFQSLSQFNRVFRRITGETPSRYRDRLPGLNGKSTRTTALVRAA